MLPSEGTDHGVSGELLTASGPEARSKSTYRGFAGPGPISIGPEGSVPPSGGIPLQIVLAGLGNVLGYLGSVARASAM
jgi:hypothetical protein